MVLGEPSVDISVLTDKPHQLFRKRGETMRRVSVILISLLLIVSTGSADQNAPKLDELFVRLGDGETSPSEAREITGEIWQTWLQNDNAEAEALMNQGISKMNQLALAQAVEIFSRLIKLEPDFAEAWNKRATVYYMMGEFELSTEDVAETLKLEPRHFGALSGQGLIYLQMERPQAAIDWFKRALEVNPFMENVRQNVKRIEQVVRGKII
jgi:tetratricopeptide (TPR) repeat protein